MRAALYEFFFLNYELVLFVYGLSFFALGLAIAMQSRSRSRLEMAGSLRWLAMFGITHGLHEWTTLLIPMYTLARSATAVATLQTARLLLLALSFAALFYFGAVLLRHRWSRLPLLSWVVTALWLGWLIWLGVGPVSDVNLWQQAAIWARYLIGFPGALLAALALRDQAERQIHPLGLDHIYRMLRVAGASLVAYAFFGGLMVPPGNFFPANAVNASALLTLTGVPAPVFRSLVGLILTGAMIRALEVFELETDRIVERLETEQQVAAERSRIGREIHDGALQRVYTAGLLLETIEPTLDGNEVARERLERAMAATDEAIEGLRTYMDDLRVAPSSLSLVEGLRQRVEDPRLSALVDVRFSAELPERDGFSPDQIAHILSIVGEALANVVRHADATRATVRAVQEDDMLYLNVEDNGSGFRHSDLKATSSSYGLRNMEERARLLGGELVLSSQPAEGTRVTVVIPWEEAPTPEPSGDKE